MKDDEIIHTPDNEGQIVLYQPDDTISLEVKLEHETVWLTQPQMVQLFNSSKGNISEHITNIYEQGELAKGSTVRKFRTVRKEGNRMVARQLEYYNLDMTFSRHCKESTTDSRLSTMKYIISEHRSMNSEKGCLRFPGCRWIRK